MSYSKNVELLEPINLSEHLDKVELYLGQVCQIAGISSAHDGPAPSTSLT